MESQSKFHGSSHHQPDKIPLKYHDELNLFYLSGGYPLDILI